MPAPATAIQFEDSLLVEQCQQGDMAAFAQLVAKYQDKVYNTCWRISGSRDDAADLTQDVFCKALESMGKFKGKSGFYTWVFRIAVNQSISHRRRSSRTVNLTTDNDDPAPVNRQADGLMRRTGRGEPSDPAAQAQDRELQALVTQALDELEDDHRAIVVLRDVEGLDYSEIAEVLEIASGTVRSRLHRARAALRERLTKVLDKV
ncbi:MAG: sigma-70 family RNA polymerase sigma factor [Phycisphaerae bacterium]|nr:sigma-70 family RNA polymerase sigma factor [Phycisphaerae bacterium]